MPFAAGLDTAYISAIQPSIITGKTVGKNNLAVKGKLGEKCDPHDACFDR